MSINNSNVETPVSQKITKTKYKPSRGKRRLDIKDIISYFILFVAIVIAVYPILRVITVSLLPNNSIFLTSLSIIPKDPTLEYYNNILFEKGLNPMYKDAPLIVKFFNASFWLWFRNSLIVSTLTVVFGVTFATTAGYVFSRFNFPGRRAGLMFFLVTQMFPITMLLLPMYLFMSKLNLDNTFWGLCFMYASNALPLCIWQMKGYYDSISYSYEEAAYVDGASHFQAFYSVVLPLVLPGIVVTALFSFMAAWTDFIVANVMLQKESLKTLALGLQSMNGKYNVEWGNFSAMSTLIMLPAMFVFMNLSKYIVTGLNIGGVKDE